MDIDFGEYVLHKLGVDLKLRGRQVSYCNLFSETTAGGVCNVESAST